MQIPRGKDWENWSHVLMSGGQKVGTGGVVNKKQYSCYLTNALASSPWTDNTRIGFEILLWAPPSAYNLCSPDVTTCDQITITVRVGNLFHCCHLSSMRQHEVVQ